MNRVVHILRTVRERALRSILSTLDKHEQRITALEKFTSPGVTITGPTSARFSESTVTSPKGKK
jgi:hypothetical protein